MRNFNTRFRLRDSDRHIRLVYTFFLLLMLAGFTFSFFWAHSMTGLSPQGIARSLPGIGCHIRRTDVVQGTGRNHPLSPLHDAGRVYDSGACAVSHQRRQPLKIITTWLSFGGVMLDLLSPWLISYVSPIFVLTMLTGDTLMTVGFLIMMLIPLYEMWVLNQPLMAGKHGKEE